jgi:imidazolonepropionase-like amidohydrolase
MARRSLFLLLASLLIAPTCALAQAPLIFTHVHVIDGTGAPATSDKTVVIAGGRITAIGNAATERVPDGARVVDASGKYLIPGLWDMHVHWYDERYLDLFVANGITGIRQMFGMPLHLEWRARTWLADRFVPRQMIASPIVDGPRPIFPGSLRAVTAEEGRQAVRQIKSGGYDFVKVYVGVPREAYLAIADEAKKQGLAFCGHVPAAVTAREASDAGQKSIEHLDGVLMACSSAEKALSAERSRMMQGVNVQTGVDSTKRATRRRISERQLATFDGKKAARLYARFVRNGTWQCPTLTVNRMLAMLGDAEFRADPRLKYMPKAIREAWQPENYPFLRTATAKDYAITKRVFRKQMETVGAMRRAGVSFLAGTDVINPYCFPGFSLHDELSLLVQAGLTPMEALQAATSNAATYGGFGDSLGTIQVGKIADLVLLDANPLEDIGNTKRIAGVVMGGRLIERAGLDEMLARVEKIANLPSIAGVLKATVESKGVAAAVEQYRTLKRSEPDAYEFGEDELNMLGYGLLQGKKAAEAVEILKLNVEAFPQSANAHDSLAEAYVALGNRELAIEHYKKSLELNPKNANAVEMLKKLVEPH